MHFRPRESSAASLKIASALVESWPRWKQNILEDSSKATFPVARTPVDNQRAAQEGDKPPKQSE